MKIQIYILTPKAGKIVVTLSPGQTKIAILT